MTARPLALGIEIGGTKLQVGVGDGGDKLLALARRAIDPARGADGIRAQIPEAAAEALATAGLTQDALGAVGCGFGGPVERATGRVLLSHHVEGWTGFSLGAWLGEQFRRPAVVQNDAKTAAYAEALIGAGRGSSRIFYLTVGSGIGGGLVVDGRVDDGQGLGAAEIGHTWVPDPDGGKPVRLEHAASGWSIGRRAREAIARGQPTLMSGDVTAETVYHFVERGDALARRILADATQALGIAIANVVALLHPERIILGGGVSLMGPHFWDPLRKNVHDRFGFPPFAGRYQIVPAALGESVVVAGAVRLAIESISR